MWELKHCRKLFELEFDDANLTELKRMKGNNSYFTFIISMFYFLREVLTYTYMLVFLSARCYELKEHCSHWICDICPLMTKLVEVNQIQDQLTKESIKIQGSGAPIY